MHVLKSFDICELLEVGDVLIPSIHGKTGQWLQVPCPRNTCFHWHLFLRVYLMPGAQELGHYLSSYPLGEGLLAHFTGGQTKARETKSPA